MASKPSQENIDQVRKEKSKPDIHLTFYLSPSVLAKSLTTINKSRISSKDYAIYIPFLIIRSASWITNAKKDGNVLRIFKKLISSMQMQLKKRRSITGCYNSKI